MTFDNWSSLSKPKM
ncbi:hypothetical protein CISIN_1g0460552mg, partial [Citrus sinensis]